jgi:hypothetical protein
MLNDYYIFHIYILLNCYIIQCYLSRSSSRAEPSFLFQLVERTSRVELVSSPVADQEFGLWYPKGSTFDLIGYSDVDYIRCRIDRKSTSETCQFLGRSLVSWASKKQNSVALSTAKAEYVVARHGCAQLLWIRQTLKDYDYKLSKVPLLCDNVSAIRMMDNPIEHSHTKHRDIRYYLLRDHQQNGVSKLLMLIPTTN